MNGVEGFGLRLAQRRNFMPTIRKPFFSIIVKISPTCPFETASGLIIAKVRSKAILFSILFLACVSYWTRAIASCIFSPISAGEGQTMMPASSMAASLSSALPELPEMMAPA